MNLRPLLLASACMAWLASIGTDLSAQDSRAGLLLVTTDRAAVCTIDSSVTGPSPLITRLQRGDHLVSCVAKVDGVSVRRKASVFMPGGQNVRVRLAMLGEKAP